MLGVPEMTPFVILNPVGNVGLIAHVATIPPVFEATKLVIAVPLV